MSWDDYADGWDEDEDARAYARAVFEDLTHLAQARQRKLTGARVFDFGCGTGLLTEKLAPDAASVVALDTSTKMIERLQRKLTERGLSNVTTSATELATFVAQAPALVADFDFVVCSSVCAFVDDYPKTVETLVRLLKPGGLFVQWDWEVDDAIGSTHGLTRAQVSQALSAAGLTSTGVDTAFEISMGGETMRPLHGVGEKPA